MNAQKLLSKSLISVAAVGIALCGISLTTATTYAAPSTASSYAIPTPQKRILKAVGVKVVTPSYIPRGFRLVKISTTKNYRVTEYNFLSRKLRSSYLEGADWTTYDLEYSNDRGGSIGMSYADRTLAYGPGMQYKINSVTNKLFGKLNITFGADESLNQRPARKEMMNSKQRYLIMPELSLLTNRNKDKDFYTLLAENITPNEFVKVAKSLSLVK